MLSKGGQGEVVHRRISIVGTCSLGLARDGTPGPYIDSPIVV